jgi:hypothetical protein
MHISMSSTRFRNKNMSMEGNEQQDKDSMQVLSKVRPHRQDRARKGLVVMAFVCSTKSD